LEGRWQTGGYSPFISPAPGNFTNSCLGMYDMNHPLMQNISAGSLCAFFRHLPLLSPGAVSVAEYQDAAHLVAYKVNNGHTGIGINAYVGDDPMQFSGPFGRVVVNAGRWLLGGGCGTPSPTPTGSPSATATPTATPTGTPSATPTCMPGGTITKPPDLGSFWHPLSPNGSYVYADSFVPQVSGSVSSLGTWLDTTVEDPTTTIRFEVWGSVNNDPTQGPDASNVIATSGPQSGFSGGLTFYSAATLPGGGSLVAGNTYWFVATCVGSTGKGDYQVGGHTQNSIYQDNGTFWYSNDPSGVDFDGRGLTPEMAFSVTFGSCGTPSPTPTGSGTPSATPTCPPGGSPGPWTQAAPVAIDHYGGFMDSDGTFAYEGGGYSFTTSGTINEFGKFNPATNTWTPLAPVPDLFNAEASGVYAPNVNKLFVFGGDDPTTGTVVNTTRIYDIATNTWSTGTAMPDVRAFMASGYFNGKIYLVGGYSTGNVDPAFGQVWEYDPVANTFNTSRASMPATLGGPGFGIINGHMYVAGG
ncbi:MAG TPA: kelch repeat-containing protein, partial [Candidatus Acidoferrum sp.]|nr:kelch repeat-containing protein [Candidatus Acidoferrum sp.]